MRGSRFSRSLGGGFLYRRRGFPGKALLTQLIGSLPQRLLGSQIVGHGYGRVGFLLLTDQRGLGEAFLSFNVWHAPTTRD